MSKNNEKKCNLKCSMCDHYCKQTDFCKEKKIENISKQVHTDFSTCDSYLVRENLVMF